MKPCPTCKGFGQIYQTEFQLGGDILTLDDKENIAKYGMLQLCTCPRCNGTGEIEK